MINPNESAQALKARIDRLEDLAFQGSELPEDLAYPEQLLFLRFRYLYAYAKLIQMDPAQGKREKEQILISFMEDKMNFDLCMKIVLEREDPA